jgi:hypothetical protein
MKNKIKENKKRTKKIDKLRLLSGTDLCACGPLNMFKCSGVCRKVHTKNEKIICSELYRVDEVILSLKRGLKRDKQNKSSFDKRKINKKGHDRKERVNSNQ